jgi:virginiamycin B lyase
LDGSARNLLGSPTGSIPGPKADLIALGPDAAPHCVIVGPDGAAWVTEGGQIAVARVDPATRAVTLFPLPYERRKP